MARLSSLEANSLLAIMPKRNDEVCLKFPVVLQEAQKSIQNLFLLSDKEILFNIIHTDYNLMLKYKLRRLRLNVRAAIDLLKLYENFIADKRDRDKQKKFYGYVSDCMFYRVSRPLRQRPGDIGEQLGMSLYRQRLRSGNDVIKSPGVITAQGLPYLSCSPDGIIFTLGTPIRILEIKTPRLSLPFPDMISKLRKDFTYDQKTRKHLFNKDSATYLQVTLYMLITNIKVTDIVYTSVKFESIYVHRVLFDEAFACANLKLIHEMYFNTILPVLTKRLLKNV